jgi:predicted helicase
MDLFNQNTDYKDNYERRDGISDWILTTVRKQYGYKATKEDVFYYVYGLLHSSEYRTMFATDLKKSLPRLPLVEKVDDFWGFSKAGHELANLHLNYETVEPYRKCQVIYAPLTNKGKSINYHVEKMRFGKIDSKTVDKSIIYYNNAITIEDIPAEAYEYVVNGKSAIEWIMERYAITTDKKSGIINDPNDWAREHNDEKYIFNLLLRIINVSVQTVKIVKSLPRLKFE